jgi:hypothetical protein
MWALDASLEPLLLKQTFKTASGSRSIKIGSVIPPPEPVLHLTASTGALLNTLRLLPALLNRLLAPSPRP